MIYQLSVYTRAYKERSDDWHDHPVCSPAPQGQTATLNDGNLLAPVHLHFTYFNNISLLLLPTQKSEASFQPRLF